MKELNLNIQLTKVAEAREYRETLSLIKASSNAIQKTEKTEKNVKEEAKFPEALI